MEKINKYPTWPQYSSEDIKSVSGILKSAKVNYWFGGICRKFEKYYASYFKHKFALSVCSGSVALDMAVKSLNLKKNDEIIVSPRSYIASAGCVINNNLKPVFADIDLDTQNISISEIKKKFSSKTRALIIVHLAGYPAEMDAIIKFCKIKKIRVIEDCSQAHGAKYKSKLAGSFGDISVWSFCYDKIISTGGEGGMILTSNYSFFKKMFAFRDCGKNFEKINKTKKIGFKWIHDFQGSNYRMTEIQAALGIRQLKNLKKNVKIRNIFCKKIIKLNNNYDFLKKIQVPNFIYHSYYRFYLFVNLEKIRKKITLEAIIKLLNNNNIVCNVGSCPEIYLEKSFKVLGGHKRRLKNAKKISNNSIALCINHCFSYHEQEKYLKSLEKIFEYISDKICI